jgi:hypothetical protein
VCCDETPLRVGARTPAVGKKKAERYLYYSRSFTKGYGSWPSVADLDRQATT